MAYRDDTEDTWVTEASGLKNKYRQRAIPLVNADLLRRLSEKPRTIQIESQRSSRKGELVETEFIFHSPEGRPYQPHNWGHRIFERFMKDLTTAYPEIPALTPHELRHTRATLWLAQGISPHVVSKLLGHCGIQMLTKVYDHTTVDTLRKAITMAAQKKRSGAVMLRIIFLKLSYFCRIFGIDLFCEKRKIPQSLAALGDFWWRLLDSNQ